MLTKIVNILTAKWFVTLVGAIILALLVWFIGDLIGFADRRPLASDVARLAASLFIIMVWGGFVILALVRARKSNDKLIAGIAEGRPAEGSKAESAEEIAILKERLNQALGTLKKARLGGGGRRQYLYELPWYILIGPPGSGKTTALVNSGLSFPLSEALGRDPVKGVGGTRYCEWMFTNEAVLLDTAGRYTTHESQQEVDRTAWLGFLDILKESRPRQPINGALVAIAISDLAIMSEVERAGHARAIRQRLRELYERLGIRFPIYVLFTKADLIAGFIEFFDDLGKEEREQVWGFTFDIEAGEGQGPLAAFGEEFDRLGERLNARLIERLHQEPDAKRRSLMFGFPAQLATLKAIAQRFLADIFQPSRFEEKPLLRGVYLTSGTQEGTPIDRIMAALATGFGIERQRLTAFSGRGRSYFIKRLLQDVVFAEASIVSVNKAQELRRTWLRRAAMAAAAALVLVVTGLWYVSYTANQTLLEQAEQQIAGYAQQISEIDLSQIRDPDLAPVLPALNALRQTPPGYDFQSAAVPWTMTFGLYQGDKVGSQVAAAYRQALNALYLPRLLLRLEEQLRGNLGRPEYLHEGLKVYLMLGGHGPLNTDLIRTWIQIDWETTYPGQQNTKGREALLVHLNALLDKPPSNFPLDGPLTEQVRSVLRQMPLAERAYGLVKQSSAARTLPAWRPIDHAGPASQHVFVRASGIALSDGVPGLYTYNGFHSVFLLAAKDAAREIAEETWIFGSEGDRAVGGADVARLERELTVLYLNDYAKQWDTLLSDIRLKNFATLADATDILNVLAGPDSPMRLLLTAVVRETKLAPPPEPKAGGPLQQAVDAARQSTTAADKSGRVAQLLGQPARPADAPGMYVEERFKTLHRLVDGKPSPLDDYLKVLGALYLEINALASTVDKNAILGDLASGKAGRGIIQQLSAAAARLPPPMNGWIAHAAAGTTAGVVAGAREQLRALWQSQVAPICQQAVNERYPFFKSSKTDIAMGDFGRLFAPGGAMDKFFATHLRPYVDDATRPWRWRSVDKIDLGLAQGALLQFQRAAEIRDSFFAGGSVPTVKFELTPIHLDAAASQVRIEIDGQVVSYSHGPTRASTLQWPGPGGPSYVRVTFSPELPGQQSTLNESGPWSWFRVLDRAKAEVRRGASDRFIVSLDLGGRRAEFELRANSVINPFDFKGLEEFRCPSGL